MRHLFALLLLCLLPTFAHAEFDPFNLPSAKAVSQGPKTKVSLISEVSAVAPDSPFTIGLKLEHPEGWHSYYVNPGIIGEKLSTEWTLPEGFSADYQGWPTPHLSSAFGYQSIGYEGTVTHLYTITPPADLTIGSNFEIKLDARWQICDEKGCVPENGSESITLSVQESAETNAATAGDFEQARAHYPEEAKGLTIKTSEANDLITVTITPAGKLDHTHLSLFDEDGQVDVQTPHTATKDGDTITLTAPRNLGNDLADAGPVKEQIKGIISDGKTSYLVESNLTETPPAQTPVNISTLLPILGGMFLGGLILNLMPCVFPVIGIKIMGFVDQAGNDRKKIMLHGIAFAAGVFASFWILTLIMLMGGIKNWGGQLENPYVMFTLIIVMLLLAMNMYGVFEIGMGATGVGSKLTHKEGLGGSFFSGVLATVVATPCSAPFLGAALGAAVALPPFWFFLSFTVMALGLSLPYLTLSAFPELVKKLPRPGVWMESFKQAMSFLLFATVGYLLWVYSAQVFEQDYGQKGLFVMIGLSLVAAAAWVWGRWTTPVKKPKTKWIARVITLGLLSTGIILAKPGAYTQEVVDLMNQHDVVFLKADKTTTNEEIDKELTKLGRSAIPVNVLYNPEAPKPNITPEVLNAGFMMKFVKETLDPS